MADLNEPADIDTDNMSMDEIRDLGSKMREGEDVSTPEPAPELSNADPALDHDDPEAALAAAEAEPADEAQKGSKTVPHKTFNYANERRKAAEKEASEAKERYARLEERTRVLLEAQQAQPKPEAPAQPEIPKFGLDPIGAGQWTQEQIISILEERRQTEEKTAAQQREEQEYKAISEPVIRDYEATKQADPTIEEAYNALRKSQGEEMLAMGYTIPEAQAELARIERDHIKFVGSRGMPIGPYIKALAAARGWAPAAPTPTPTPDPKANDKLEAARKAGASLGSSGGAVANSGTITPDMLADMPEADFQEYMKKHGSTRGAFAA